MVPRPVSTQKPHPNKAVMGRGIGSVIHMITTQVKMAANMRAESDSVSGISRNINPAMIGATTKPRR
jgi:hypothetical protein